MKRSTKYSSENGLTCFQEKPFSPHQTTFWFAPNGNQGIWNYNDNNGLTLFLSFSLYFYLCREETSRLYERGDSCLLEQVGKKKETSGSNSDKQARRQTAWWQSRQETRTGGAATAQWPMTPSVIRETQLPRMQWSMSEKLDNSSKNHTAGRNGLRKTVGRVQQDGDSDPQEPVT